MRVVHATFLNRRSRETTRHAPTFMLIQQLLITFASATFFRRILRATFPGLCFRSHATLQTHVKGGGTNDFCSRQDSDD
jgi:hypothetical protein